MHKSGTFKKYILRFARASGLAVLLALSGHAATADAATAHVTGTATDQNGLGVPGLSVTAVALDGGSSNGPVATSPTDGYYDMSVDTGLSGHTYDLHFLPPSGSGLNEIVAANVTVSSDRVLNVVLAPVIHTFSGTVRTSDGNPVTGYQANRVQLFSNGPGNGPTEIYPDTSGHFAVSAAPGVYNYSLVSVNTGVHPSPQGYSLGATNGVDLTAGDVNQDIILDTVDVAVTVKDGSGALVNGAVVAAQSSTGQVTNVFPGGPGGNISSSDQAGTDSSGVAHIVSLRGATYDQSSGQTNSADNVCAAINGKTICMSSPIGALNSNTSLTIVAPVIHTFSGTIRTSDGAPVTGYQASRIQLFSNGPGNGPTEIYPDSSGHFSISAAPGSYRYRLQNVNFGSHPAPQRYTLDMPNGVNLTSGDVNQDIVFDAVDVAITVKDVLGNPVAGAVVRAQSTSAQVAHAFLGGPSGAVQSLDEATTDASGVAHVVSLRGTAYNQSSGQTNSSDNICAAINGQNICMGSPIAALTTDVAFLFQQQPPAPSAPTNLSAASPTNTAPALSWSGVSGASSYNIYRSGTLIGNSTASSFTDFTIMTNGSYAYTVTARASNGAESPASASITVVYNTLPPSISYTLSPTPNSSGWNNAPVTVTFTCNDSGSGVGIAACTAPVTVNTNGANQTVTGTTTDNAGNRASVTATLNLDQTVPIVGMPAWSDNPVVTGNSTILTATPVPAPNLSPIIGGEYYLGSTDPGLGQATVMAWNGTNLSASLSFNSTGIYQVHVRAKNSAGAWSTAVLAPSLQVNPAPVAPTITSPSSYTTGVRQIITPANFTFTTTGTPDPALSEIGALPSGLTFTDSGNGKSNFSGMVAAGTAGTYNITIRATNSAGSISQNFVLTITNANSAPTTIFPSSSNLSFTKGSPMSLSFTATGNGSNFKIFIYGGSLPPGLSLHDNKDGTASFFGTPTTSGVYTFTIEAQNKSGMTFQQFTVRVI